MTCYDSSGQITLTHNSHSQFTTHNSQLTTHTMSFTESTMLPLGSEAPPFALPDTISGNTIRLQDIASDKATVVMFICNHCPYVIHVNAEIVRLANDYIARGIAFVAISSNDVINYPQDGPGKMKEHAVKALKEKKGIQHHFDMAKMYGQKAFFWKKPARLQSHDYQCCCCKLYGKNL